MPADIHQLLIVFTAYIIAAGSPGPSTMRIMGVAMHEGRKAALALASGVVSGSIFWGMMAATGVSAVLKTYPDALVALQIFGGLYLLFLSLKAAKAAALPDKATTVEDDHARPSMPALYRRGLLMHLMNPKSILAWIALMTLGLGPDASTATIVFILVGCAVLSVSIFCGYAVLFSTGPMVRFYRRVRRWIEGTLALSFGLAGVKLLLSRI
ncbi:LysE family translocator [Agrobacterium tumefaciens]|uniref:Amino acid transporter n=1 Tax=Agrobacterium tumefaciens TaxID=358 RepID=A0A2L2LL08_AGRTU|nr:LysE family translocator [Agrobacterium tumefaciens]AVH45015.1 amino acid transporter [Agrobacterium tumefaciens]NSY98907.1 LysE family translocator [Agrobacterium tumefaciens]